MTASRNFQQQRSYHVTHRCHDRRFLLGAGVDRDEYVRLMLAARRRHGVSILSYVLTSNHVHLLLSARRGEDIRDFMAHVSGGIARHYNSRKKRRGAFWEGRYHSTLVQDGEHLSRCLFYIALNMVRAGVVMHPEGWTWSSHLEMTGQRRRYRLVDMETLLRKLRSKSPGDFASWYGRTLDEKCRNISLLRREPWWSQSSCVGTAHFVASSVGKARKEDIVMLEDGTAYC